MFEEHFEGGAHLISYPQRVIALAQVLCREGVTDLVWVTVFQACFLESKTPYLRPEIANV